MERHDELNSKNKKDKKRQERAAKEPRWLHPAFGACVSGFPPCCCCFYIFLFPRKAFSSINIFLTVLLSSIVEVLVFDNKDVAKIRPSDIMHIRNANWNVGSVLRGTETHKKNWIQCGLTYDFWCRNSSVQFEKKRRLLFIRTGSSGK